MNHTAELRNWFRIGDRLGGEIFNDTSTHGKHPFPDGLFVRTSPVVKLGEGYAHTVTGTVYLLKDEMK